MINQETQLVSIGKREREMNFTLHQEQGDAISAVQIQEGVVSPASIKLKTKGSIHRPEVKKKVYQELEGYFIK